MCTTITTLNDEEIITEIIKSCSSLDYENTCQHDFSQGCPAYKGDSWRCAEALTNCSTSQMYHCVLNSTVQPFKAIHTCAHRSQCVKGTIPIYDERKKAISCKPCPEGYYQSLSRWSNEAPVCLEKHKCEEAGNKIECDMGTGLSNTQDVYCRCDTINNFVLKNYLSREKCVEWNHATCYYDPCPNGQERLSNYSCAPLCPQGQQRYDDICIPIRLNYETTSSLYSRLIMPGETTPKTTTRDSNIAGVVLLLFLVLCFFAVYYRKCIYTGFLSVRNYTRTRRQTSNDAHTELEEIVII